MSDLAAIVRATQASARALQTMADAAHRAADASRTIEHNLRQVAAGRINHAAAEVGNRIARAKKEQAELTYRKARGRHANAQRVLANNPLPGDADLSNLS